MQVSCTKLLITDLASDLGGFSSASTPGGFFSPTSKRYLSVIIAYQIDHRLEKIPNLILSTVTLKP